ncbi:hypothetical protein J4221_00945 [Candidatus Pacearchaeota archaeon]|nr:hypothetical protein [Candidatus Pacearchaeota archaeon]
MDGIEKVLAGTIGASTLAATYVTISDLAQLETYTLDGLHCVITDPRLLVSVGAGITAGAILGLYRYGRDIVARNYNKKIN